MFNANPRHDSHNEQALAFALRHGLRQTAGSDTHMAEDVGRAGLWLPRLPRTPPGWRPAARPGSRAAVRRLRDTAAAPVAADPGRRAAPPAA